MWKNKHEVELESRPLCIPRQRSAICGSGFDLTRWGYVGSARGSGCEAQFLWLRTKPGKNQKAPRLASLISLLRKKSGGAIAMGVFFIFSSAPIAVVSLEHLRLSLRYPEASLWWDQAMFGHECGFGRRDVNEREWKLTELNSWEWRFDAEDGSGQTRAANLTIQVCCSVWLQLWEMSSRPPVCNLIHEEETHTYVCTCNEDNKTAWGHRAFVWELWHTELIFLWPESGVFFSFTDIMLKLFHNSNLKPLIIMMYNDPFPPCTLS